jgi:flagellar basal-body rod protein FlgG
MINGLYTSASGMNAELTKQETIANNIANVNTAGYKKDQALFSAFPTVLVHRINDRLQAFPPVSIPKVFVESQPAPLLGELGHGTSLDGIVTDYSNGSYVRTDGKLDLAIEGNAFFTLELKDGNRGYTRAGSFTLNEEGKLSTPAGDLVLGSRNAPIEIHGKDVLVDAKGRVLVDGAEVDHLMLTSFEKSNDLVKRGESVYLSADEQGLSTEPSKMNAVVRQGYVEQANVTVIKEMVDMISVLRAYEANQKAIQEQDATLNQAVNEVGKV